MIERVDLYVDQSSSRHFVRREFPFLRNKRRERLGNAVSSRCQSEGKKDALTVRGIWPEKLSKFLFLNLVRMVFCLRLED
jgi:hypothetical protein